MLTSRSTVLSLSSVLNVYFAAATSYRPTPELINQLFIKFEVTILHRRRHPKAFKNGVRVLGLVLGLV